MLFIFEWFVISCFYCTGKAYRAKVVAAESKDEALQEALNKEDLVYNSYLEDNRPISRELLAAQV